MQNHADPAKGCKRNTKWGSPWGTSIIAMTESCKHFPRPGSIVLFCTPCKKPVIEVGMVVSVWKGLRAPRLHASAVPVGSCLAFRALRLDMADEQVTPPTQWKTNSKADAWMVRMEGLMAILDCESCGWDSLGVFIVFLFLGCFLFFWHVHSHSFPRCMPLCKHTFPVETGNPHPFLST